MKKKILALVLAVSVGGLLAAPTSFTDPAWRRIIALPQTVSALWTYAAGIITTTLTASTSIDVGTAGTAGTVTLYGTDGVTNSTISATSAGTSLTINGSFPRKFYGQLSGLTCASNTVCYVPVSGQRQSAFVTTAGATQSILVPDACTLSNLQVQTLGTNGAQATVFLVETNAGTSTGLTVTSAGADTARVYTDSTHTYLLTAGDRVYMKISQGNGAASATLGAVTVTCQ